MIWRLAVLTTGLLLAAGCAAAPAPAGALLAADTNPVARAALRPGGTLVWAVPDFPEQWNIYQLAGLSGVADQVLRALLPYLMRSDPAGVTRPDPDYLTSVSLRRTAHGQTVTYTINPHATWSNGTPLTFRDLRAQVAALSGRDQRYQAATTVGYRYITKVTQGATERQAVVTFARPYADWRSLFSPLYPSVTDQSPERFNGAWVNRIPVTAGPFREAAINPSTKTVILARDPHWWGDRAELNRIVFLTLDPAAMPDAFANHEVDVMDIGADAGAYAQVRAVPGTSVRAAGGANWRQLTLNARRPPLRDVRVRQAIVLALDRNAIARSELQGLGWPIRTMGNHFLVNTQRGYTDHAPPYDPVAARRLLAAAGHAHGLTLHMVIPAGLGLARQESELVQAMLHEVGIELRIKAVPSDVLFNDYIRPGDFDLAPFSWVGTPFPVSNGTPIFRQGAGGENVAHAGSPRIDRLLDRAAATLNEGRALRLLNRIDRLVWRQAAVIPFYQRPEMIAVRADLANIGAPGLGAPVYQDIGYERSR